MDNGMVRKYEKAKLYAQQLERIQVQNLEVAFDGKNNPHIVKFNQGEWQCDCDFFIGHKRCSHTMALEIIFDQMLPTPAPVE